MRRKPFQTLLIAVAVVIGLVAGVNLVLRQVLPEASRRGQKVQPDIDAEHLAPQDLVTLGFRLSGKEPASWRDISIRLRQDEQGGITCLRCIVDPNEADRLVSWPAGSRCPIGTRPPEDWPWGTTADHLAVPAWWQPDRGRARLYECPSGTNVAAVGIFANYDPATRILHLWQWQRRDWAPARPSPLTCLVADELVSCLVEALRLAGGQADSHGWFHVTGLAPGRWGVDPSRIPKGWSSVSAAILPIKGRHRYLVKVQGIDEAEAWRLVAEQPMAPYADDGPVPRERWSFAQPPERMPTWFAPGPGPRRGHCLRRIGSGIVEAARWAAYDRQARELFIWDWQDEGGRDAASAFD